MALDPIPQIDAMRMGVDYRFAVTMRGFTILLRPLSMQESIEVTSKVAERIMMVPETMRHRLTEHTFLASETLVLASTSDVGAGDPKITELICQRMTPDELQAMFREYVAGCDRCNPALEKMTDADLRKLAEDLKKSPPSELPSQLIALSLLQLSNLVASLLPKGD